MPSALPASCTAHLSSHSLESEPRRTSPPPPLLGWGHRAQSRWISQPEAFSLPHSSCGTEESRSPGKIYSWDQEGPTRRPHCASRPPSSRNVRSPSWKAEQRSCLSAGRERWVSAGEGAATSLTPTTSAVTGHTGHLPYLIWSSLSTPSRARIITLPIQKGGHTLTGEGTSSGHS